MPESEELSAARVEVGRAVLAFVRVQAKELGVEEDVFVAGWAAFAEYYSGEMVRNDSSGRSWIVPDDQHATTSRGLFEFGADRFRG